MQIVQDLVQIVHGMMQMVQETVQIVCEVMQSVLAWLPGGKAALNHSGTEGTEVFVVVVLGVLCVSMVEIGRPPPAI